MKAPRRIQGLKWARPCSRPKNIPKGRPRGSKAAGLAYERKLAKAICGEFALAHHGQWYEFEDANGHGYCQTDVVIPEAEGVVCIEVKLSAQAGAWLQANGLYKPVLEYVYRKPIICIVATKYLRSERAGDYVAESLGHAKALARDLKIQPLWHWIGSGPL